MDVLATIGIPPPLRDNFLHLCKHGKLGLTPITLNDIDVITLTNNPSDPLGYHCRFSIPYAGTFLKWELLFNPKDYFFAPDFYFHDKKFPPCDDIDIFSKDVPSLEKWNVKNVQSLEMVLKEFVNLFKKTQIKELENNIFSRILTEYTLLISCEDPIISPDDVEILVDNSSVHLLILLNMDIQIPEFIQESYDKGELVDPGSDDIKLKISFLKLDASDVKVHLQLSPRLDQLLGHNKKIQPPKFKQDLSLLDYVPLIKEVLVDLIEERIHSHHMKEELINLIVDRDPESIVEYDPLRYKYVHFFHKVDDYVCLVQISFGDNFRANQISVKLKSLHCIDRKTMSPCEEPVKVNYPTNNSHSVTIVAKCILLAIKQSISKFKIHVH